MDKDRQLILNFLESGKDKKKIEEKLKDASFRNLYASVCRDEAALYQTFETAKVSIVKFKKKSHTRLLILTAMAAMLTIGFLFKGHFLGGLAKDTVTQAWVIKNQEIRNSESKIYLLNDGSTLKFNGPSKVIFRDENNIEILSGLVTAKINPRPNNKLTLSTPAGPFTVLGTQFSLWINNSSTLLSVEEGKVSVAGKVIETNQEACLLESGQLVTDPEVINRVLPGGMLRKTGYKRNCIIRIKPKS